MSTVTSDFRPIETIYDGYRFRSRLEARWAVFFNTLRVKYLYEKEGYVLHNGEQYLPDFRLVDAKMWAEVKGEAFTPEQREKCRLLTLGTGYNCIMLDGLPTYWPYEGWTNGWSGTSEVMPTAWVLDSSYLADNHFEESAGYTRAEWLRRDVTDDEAQYACTAARHARFEWGETPPGRR